VLFFVLFFVLFVRSRIARASATLSLLGRLQLRGGLLS